MRECLFLQRSTTHIYNFIIEHDIKTTNQQPEYS